MVSWYMYIFGEKKFWGGLCVRSFLRVTCPEPQMQGRFHMQYAGAAKRIGTATTTAVNDGNLLVAGILGALAQALHVVLLYPAN